ncbi:ferritin family protein [Arthrobacter sp. NPDC055138]
MGFDQYHEPAQELSAETRTFARMCANLTEEAEAIGWYEQRMSLEKDPESVAIMEDSLAEEFKHFSMDLEFLLRRKPKWRQIARGTLFQDGDIVANGGAAEAAAAAGSSAEAPAEDSGSAPGRPDSSLGIGSLREDFS